ncbi:MAG TPA: hypothetical protein PKW66_18710, partial [Polyangiaceae bacterium]|nr:hypothetical protein [Polyangiaceae bacterium]
MNVRLGTVFMTLLLSVGLLMGPLGCGGSSEADLPPGTGFDAADAPNDAPDAASDSSGDSSPDVALDVPPDVAPDVVPAVAPDVAPDVVP